MRLPAGVTDVAFADLVMRDCRDQVSDEEADTLREDTIAVRLWRDMLVVLAKDAAQRFAEIKAETEAKRQRSLEQGWKGKNAFFKFSAEKDRERAEWVEWNNLITNRLQEAKALLREDGESIADERLRQFARIEEKLDRILAVLTKRPGDGSLV